MNHYKHTKMTYRLIVLKNGNRTEQKFTLVKLNLVYHFDLLIAQ